MDTTFGESNYNWVFGLGDLWERAQQIMVLMQKMPHENYLLSYNVWPD